MKPCSGLLCALVLLSAFLSCTGKEWSDSVTLDSNTVLGEGIGWALVTDVYARIKASPSFASADGANSRRGDLVRLVERKPLRARGPDTGIWFRVEGDGFSGWLHETSLSPYRTKAEAVNAGKAMK